MEGITFQTGLPVSGTHHKKGPRVLVCTPVMMTIILGEVQQRMWDGLSIILPALDVVRVFGENCKLS